MNKLVAALALVGFGLSGCVVHTDDDPIVVSDYGYLDLSWTIAGSRNSSICAAYDVDVISVRVGSRTENWEEYYEAVCEDFATSIKLLADSYEADAVLLDPDGRTITTTVDLGYFRLYGDEDSVPIRAVFPDASFL